jgi:site-specific recombinase XerD
MKIYEETRDLLVVQAALGHRSLSSTVVYARVAEERVRRVVAAC